MLKLFRLPRPKIPIGIRLKRVLAIDRHDGHRCRVIRLPDFAASIGHEKSPSCTGASRRAITIEKKLGGV